ncbi:MAG: penicillin-binding protein 2 [Xanthomonadales bacterium]|nr:penicillin-binding protein 2 [Xanthomonadales bacterium]
MKRPAYKPLKDTLREAHLFRVRAWIGFALIVLVFLILATRFFYLQIVKHDDFITQSEANRVKIRAVPPNRGLIFDRNGVLLADNRPAYRLELVPEQVEDLEQTLERLGRLITLAEDDLERFEQLRRARPSFQGIPLRLRLTETEAAAFAVNRHRFNGVDIVAYQNRVYPFGPSLAHLVGYVGRLGPDDLKKVDASDYAATSHLGKTGIERFYEDRLHGTVGYEQVETNAQGRVLGVLESNPSVSGHDLFLTIDVRLQLAAEAALGERPGAVVAVEPASGEILAMASNPSFDPNLFVNGISAQAYRELLNSRYRPLFNRALQGGYEPGSTIKPYMALAGLELGVITPEDTVFSRGFFRLAGQERRYRDWKKGGHGRVNVVQAIEQSVNVYFYELAVDLGIERIHDYLAQFGFGQPTGLDLLGESSGVLPSREWKRRVHAQPWYPGETVIAGIGQGFMVTTPLQLAHGISALAMRGETRHLHLLHAVRDPLVGDIVNEAPPPVREIPVADWQNWEVVIDGMEAVLHGSRGTARAVMADDPGYRMAGKTGTAQVYGRSQDEEDEREQDELPEHLRNHALFVGFAPTEAPRIAVAVVVEHGGGGASVAAPLAREVVQAYLELP